MIRHPQSQRLLPGGVRRRSFVAGAAALSLAGCGGGELFVLIPGVGTGGTGVVAGVVTGLGSIFMDGRRYDDSQAVLERQADLQRTETLALSDLHLGQYAYLHMDALGTPMRVRLESQLVGPAAELAASRFTVWGQGVAVNGDPSAGPVTVFAGFSGLHELAESDPVQVYGLVQPDPADPDRDLIHATRIERIQHAALPARITGHLRLSGGAWSLAGVPLDTAPLAELPQQGPLAAGMAVTVVVPWPGTPSAIPPRWSPTALQRLGLPRFAADRMRVSGAAQLLPGALMVQGVRIDLAQVGVAAAQAALASANYVTVEGPLDAATGQLTASILESMPRGGRAMELHGSVTEVIAPGVFIVRGQRVDATRARFAGGTAAMMAAGRYVEVAGTAAGWVLAADSVAMPSALPEQAALDLTGTVQSVDSGTRTVRLLLATGETVTVSVGGMMSVPRIGDTIRAAGFWHGGMLQVREMSRAGPMR